MLSTLLAPSLEEITMNERIQTALTALKETESLDADFMEALAETGYEYAEVFEALAPLKPTPQTRNPDDAEQQ